MCKINFFTFFNFSTNKNLINFSIPAFYIKLNSLSKCLLYFEIPPIEFRQSDPGKESGLGQSQFLADWWRRDILMIHTVRYSNTRKSIVIYKKYSLDTRESGGYRKLKIQSSSTFSILPVIRA